MMLLMMRVVLLLWLLSSFAIETTTAQTTTTTTTSCNLCRGGEPILFPDKSISIPGFAFLDTCGSLGAVLPFLGPNSTECGLLQSLGTLCGCPMQQNACQLCREQEEEEEEDVTGSVTTSNSTTIPTPESVLSNPQGDLPFLSFLFGGVVPTCELYEAYLHNFNDTTSDCIVGQEFLSQYCGCPSLSSSSLDIPSTPAMNNNDNDSTNTAPTPCNLCPSGANMTTPNANISIPGFPFRTCHELNDAVIFLTDEGSPQCDLVQSISSLCGCPPPQDQQERCTLCEDGSSAPFPDKPVQWATGAFLGVTPTCALYEAYVNGLSQDDTSCSLAQTLGPHCGCAPSVQDHCVFCEGGFPQESLQNDMYIIDTDEENTGIAPTCELFETFQYSLRPRDGFCMVGQYLGYVCGCNGGRAKYYGADQQWQKILLVWLQRVSGILSFIGATCIQVDVIRDKRRRARLYNQLVFAMSIFDDMTALALMVGPAAIPTIHDFYGVAGNDLSCQIQGFFVQAGVISIFYNVTLTFYYKLSIVDGWREDRLKSWRLAFHGIPLAIGFGYAFAGIPYYNQTPLFCHLNTFPLVDEWETVLVFGYIPVSTAIVVLTSMMIYILVRIRSQQNKGARWSAKNAARSSASTGSSQKRSVLDSMLRRRRTDEATVHRIRNKLVEQVYWQAFSYLLCFYITWPIIHAAEVYGGLVVGGGWFWFWCLVAWASPLQGMSNALVYFRPRWQRARIQKQRERQRRRRLAGQEQPNQNHRHQQQQQPLHKRLWNLLQCQRKEAYLDSKVLSTANTVSVASLPTNNNNNSQSEEPQPDGTMMMMDNENITNFDNDNSATSLDLDVNDDDMSNSSLLYEPSAAVAAEDLLERLICDEIRNNPQQQQRQEQQQQHRTPFVRRMSTEEGFLEDIDEGSQEDADDDDDDDDDNNTNKQVSGSSSQEKPKQRRASWGGFFFRSGSSGDIDETWKNNNNNNKSDRDISLFELRRKASPSPRLSNDKKKKKKKRRATWSPLDWFSSLQYNEDNNNANNKNTVRYQSRYGEDMFLFDPASPEDFSPPPLPEGSNNNLMLGSATLRHCHARSVLLQQHSSTLGSIKEGGEGEESSSSCCSSLEFSPVSRRDRIHHHHHHNNENEDDDDNENNTIPNHHTALVENGKLPFDGHGKPNF